MIAQADIWWVDMGNLRGSEAGYLRPAVVVQSDDLNNSRLDTIVCIPMTSNLRMATSKTCAIIRAGLTGLDRDSLAIAVQVQATDRSAFIERIGRISSSDLARVLRALDAVFDR